MMRPWHSLSLLTCIALICLSGFSACAGKSNHDSSSGGGSGMGTGGGPMQGGQGGDVCAAINQRYAEQVAAAQACNPALSVEQCTLSFPVGLACGCESFLNPENQAALSALKTLLTSYIDNGCNKGIVCGACLVPKSAYCSEDGSCRAGAEPAGRSCKVNGVVYQSGAGGIPDPTSCNTCSCTDGSLVCTEIYCPVACPPGTAFGTQCAECAPNDACLVVEYGCLPTCVDSCPNGLCSHGVCLTGLCG